MLKVSHFDPFPGRGGEGYIYLPLQIIAIKSEPQQIFLKTNLHVQLKHDIRSLRYVSRCFVKRR